MVRGQLLGWLNELGLDAKPILSPLYSPPPKWSGDRAFRGRGPGT